LFYTVYKITNNINGKYYIGKHQTKDLDDGYMGSGKLVRYAIDKYGIENFTKEILYIFNTEEEMNTKEAELVVVSEETYNLCEGGKGGFGYINTLERNGIWIAKRPEPANKSLWKSNISKTKKIEYEKGDNPLQKLTYMQNMKRIRNSAKGHVGNKRSELTKIRMSESNKGSKNSQFGTCWITNGNEVKKIPLEALDSHLEMGYRRGRK